MPQYIYLGSVENALVAARQVKKNPHHVFRFYLKAMATDNPVKHKYNK